MIQTRRSPMSLKFAVNYNWFRSALKFRVRSGVLVLILGAVGQSAQAALVGLTYTTPPEAGLADSTGAASGGCVSSFSAEVASLSCSASATVGEPGGGARWPIDSNTVAFLFGNEPGTVFITGSWVLRVTAAGGTFSENGVDTTSSASAGGAAYYQGFPVASWVHDIYVRGNDSTMSIGSAGFTIPVGPLDPSGNWSIEVKDYLDVAVLAQYNVIFPTPPASGSATGSDEWIATFTPAGSGGVNTPEPGTLSLLSAGLFLVLLGHLSLKRRRQSSLGEAGRKN